MFLYFPGKSRDVDCLEIYKYFNRYCFFFFFLGTGCDAILGTESRWAGCHRFSVGPDGHGKIPLFGAKIACLWHCSCHYQVRQSKCHDRLSWDHLSSYHSTEWCTPVRRNFDLLHFFQSMHNMKVLKKFYCSAVL